MSEANLTHLFIYGTLLESAQHPMGQLLRTHGNFVARGFIRARLYIIDEVDEHGHNSFPAAVPSFEEEDRVHGEVFALRAPEIVLPQFDDYEACSPRWPQPHEFLRRTVKVHLEDGKLVEALSYLYTYDISRARHVPGGRFTEISSTTR
jgi:gamma-glutamylcyclotransferase (GGCT)/AIG2-like uncharacterized protein YtfP